MAGEHRYLVDLGELDATIAELERLERELEETTNDLERQIARLHDVWEGLSATAQREAHEEWEAGMAEMREALASMRSAGRVAHENYSKAIATTSSMWEGLA